ncbi:hypothetical protein EVC24_132 [Rhizobium phage RHph_I4]|nr:hypothetical protein EVC24_132 [Rhizobium phage RHph_I4]
MTTVREHLASMLRLVENNPAAADMKLFARHGASGDCNEIGSPQITDRVDDCGPFDLEDGEKYVSVYVGN